MDLFASILEGKIVSFTVVDPVDCESNLPVFGFNCFMLSFKDAKQGLGMGWEGEGNENGQDYCSYNSLILHVVTSIACVSYVSCLVQKTVQGVGLIGFYEQRCLNTDAKSGIK